MRFLDTLYYHYYLFYKGVLKETTPEITAVLALSFCQSLLINSLVDIIALKGYCYKVGKWYMLGIAIGLIVFNYNRYITQRRQEELLRVKPLMWNSRKWSILISWLFFFNYRVVDVLGAHLW